MHNQVKKLNPGEIKLDELANQKGNKLEWRQPQIKRLELKRTLIDATTPYNDGTSFTSVEPL